jgi:GDPmannose 4,6-dehydratase
MAYATEGIEAIQPFLFNHESPRRPEGFLSKKVADHIKERKTTKGKILKVGNLNESRDWSHAEDMANYIWKCIEDMPKSAPKLGSGISRRVADFIRIMFEKSGEQCKWGANQLISSKGEILCESVPDLQKEHTYFHSVATPNMEPKFSFEEMIQDLLK